MTVTKYVLPVVVGAMAAMMLITLGETYVGTLYPLRPGTDRYDAASLAAGMRDMPDKAFMLLLVNYMVCSFVGGIAGTLFIKRESARPSVVIGIVLTFAGLYNFLYLPHPSWFAVNLLVYIPFSYLGYLLLRRKEATV
ncbi:MAG: hypothetical protein JWQ38_3148 [Flavipsychrobacter sp.]|nr:hypothetical protein [Flavipsychrobacter sp.]